jgi:formylglycine-generating enzyme required for sulfatase activity
MKKLSCLLFLFVVIACSSTQKNPFNQTLIDAEKNNEQLVLVKGLLVSKHEVTISEYRSFLISLKNSFGLDSALTHYPSFEQVQNLRMHWINSTCNAVEQDSVFDRMTSIIFIHPAYYDYPIANIKYEDAKAYCVWKTKEEAFKMLVKEGILKESGNAIYEDSHGPTITELYDKFMKSNFPQVIDRQTEFRKVRVDDYLQFEQYDLPSRREWEYFVGNRLKRHKWYQKIDSFDIALNLENFEDCHHNNLQAMRNLYTNEFGIKGAIDNVSEILNNKEGIVGGNPTLQWRDSVNSWYRPYVKNTPYLGFRTIVKLKPWDVNLNLY